MTTPPPPPPPGSMPTGPDQPSSDDKTMAMLAHGGIVILGFLAPLLVYLVKGADSPWLKKESAKAFNFTIIFTAVGFLFLFARIFLNIIDPTGIIDLALLCINCLLMPALWITNAVFGVMNAMKINNDEETRYPFEVPLLK